jgi:N-acetylmuramoyl-L-alanine amidase
MGEADECSQLEKIAVAYTVINRVNDSAGRKSIKEIILAPRQYSCFNKGTDSLKFLKDPMKYNKKEFVGTINLAEDILSGKYNDPTKGATHYYNPSLIKTPKWAKELKNIGKIGHHIFFK